VSEHLNPVAVEHSIRTLIDSIAKGVPIVSAAEYGAREAKRKYDLALARAYLEHNGPAHEKKYAATLATEQERTEYDIADVTYSDAERISKALEAQLRGWQSLGASVREMYATGGHR
jgi:hypothetical protein